jgi:hypothetical protein
VKIEIKNRFTGTVIYSTEVEDNDPAPMRKAVERAVADGASLNVASLNGASLDGASLDGASLNGASLDGASLNGASLDPIKADVRAVLDGAPLEVAGLLAKLRAGHVDGSVYEGECACLVGTIANLRGCKVTALPSPIAPDSSRPAERWFLGIGLGATPDTNPVAAITDDWICEWMAERGEGDLISEVQS